MHKNLFYRVNIKQTGFFVATCATGLIDDYQRLCYVKFHKNHEFCI